MMARENLDDQMPALYMLVHVFLKNQLAGALKGPTFLKPFITPIFVTDEKYGRIPRVYISCLRDKAISPTIQEQMYSNLPCQRIIKMDQ